MVGVWLTRTYQNLKKMIKSVNRWPKRSFLFEKNKKKRKKSPAVGTSRNNLPPKRFFKRRASWIVQIYVYQNIMLAKFWVRISSTFSVLWPFSDLEPFLYFDRSISTSLPWNSVLRLAYSELFTSNSVLQLFQIWISYWSKSIDQTVLVEVNRSK